MKWLRELWVRWKLRNDDYAQLVYFKGCYECGCREFLEGPSGGMCTNIKCERCGKKYNVAEHLGYVEEI